MLVSLDKDDGDENGVGLSWTSLALIGWYACTTQSPFHSRSPCSVTPSDAGRPRYAR